MASKRAEIKRMGILAVLASFCCALWGSAFPVVKWGYALSGMTDGSVWQYIYYAGLRFVLAGALLWVMTVRKIGLPKRQDWQPILWISLFQTVLQYTFFYIGVSKTSGTGASIIAGGNVFVAVMISSLVFHNEKLTAPKVIGCLLGFFGILWVHLHDFNMLTGMHWLGEGLVFMATISYAISTNLMKRFGKTSSPVLLATYQFIVGGIVMLAAGNIFGGTVTLQTAQSIGVLGYLSGVSAIAYVIWSLLLKAYPVSSVAVFGFTTPIFGVIFSDILLAEAGIFDTTAVWIALLLIAIGIMIVNRSEGV
ncbi:DMT family transporter [Fusibacter paucivorans]|uniref:DMT family transporter n=1 Tax=Fusibacter paucivorans TaxID=76009 RepID=A0ABS5PPL7_9FIRM|nr:DMT family transporter [Fusibacter paucivorans]MBS7526296.1 DMT family transporter [Fusibacter paucivorans]